ncbi:MAG: 50S ribosomal protein L28 [Candidatus Omnitrophota bacterium]
MSKVCTICGKHSVAGRSIVRRGMAKKKGGVGKKITGITARQFLPNLQSVKILKDGKPKRVRVCTKCIKAGKVIKHPRLPSRPSGQA